MWSSTQVNQVSVLICSNLSIFRDLGVNQLDLEWVVGKKIQSFLFSQNESVEGLLFRYDFFGCFFNGLIIFLLENLHMLMNEGRIHLVQCRRHRRNQIQLGDRDKDALQILFPCILPIYGQRSARKSSYHRLLRK